MLVVLALAPSVRNFVLELGARDRDGRNRDVLEEGDRMSIELMMTPKIAESNCLAAISDPKARRDDVAVCYADMIRYCPADSDWLAVNMAIMNRWSKSALEHIKKLAWRIAKKK
jgi:hypothetical protein